MSGTFLHDRILVPTGHGMVRISELKAGDEVFNEYGHPVVITGVVADIKNIATIQLSHGVDWNNQNHRYSLGVSLDSSLFMREQSEQLFDIVSVEQTTHEPIITTTEQGVVNRWVLKRGQKFETPRKIPGDSKGYEGVLAIFSDAGYVIPDYYIHGSRMQKECVRDTIQNNTYFQDGVFYLINVSVPVLMQVSELLEDLGHQVYPADGGIMWTMARIPDMQVIDIISLGYRSRVWGIETDAKMPFQVGRCHAVAESI